MFNWLKPRIDYFITKLQKDLSLISSKQKDDEWKRDHYRYAFIIFTCRLFELLNLSITGEPVAKMSNSTKNELLELRKQIDKLLEE